MVEDMVLNFPNLSRGDDPSKHCIRFWAYDPSLEIPFFVEEEALCSIDPIGTAPIQEQAMAKGQKRSNREIKKPKKAKLKSPATGPASSSANVKPGPLGRGKKT
jgi:hypothetical protein